MFERLHFDAITCFTSMLSTGTNTKEVLFLPESTRHCGGIRCGIFGPHCFGAPMQLGISLALALVFSAI